MSVKEDKAFKEWGESLRGELEPTEHEALDKWLALPIAREVFRGTIGQDELYRRMNKLAEEQKAVEAKAQQLDEWWEENAPKNEALLAERDELKQQLAAVGSGGPPPAEGTGIKLSKDELAQLKANAQKAAVLDQLLPDVLSDMGRVLKDSIQNNFDVDSGEVIQLALKRGIPPYRAYLELTADERQKRAETEKEAERKKWYEEGRKSVQTNSPDHFQPSGPTMFDYLQELNKGAEKGGKDVPSNRDRISAAMQALQEGNFTE